MSGNSQKASAKILKRHDQYFVYIVQCTNGAYYTGYTSDVTKRIKAHNTNRGAKYLKGKGPVQLVFLKEYAYYKNALKGEKEIKKFPRKKKEKLIQKCKYELSMFVEQITNP